MIDFEDLAATLIDRVDGYFLIGLQALVILVLGWVAARWIGWLVRRALTGRRRVDQTLVGFLASTTRYVVLTVVLIAVLARLGIETTSLVAIVGAAGLAVGFALRDTLAHVASGVLLLIVRPFSVGDFVEAGGIAGTIDEINIFSTAMHTPDNVRLIVPNSHLWDTAIKNFNVLPTRRIDVTIGIGYGDQIGEAIESARTIVAADQRILTDPVAAFAVTGLGDSAVDLMVRVWCKREDYWQVQWDLNRNLKEAFDSDGIEIPFPQRVVHMVSSG